MRISTAHAGEDAQSTTAVLVIPGGTRPTLHQNSAIETTVLLRTRRTFGEVLLTAEAIP